MNPVILTFNNRVKEMPYVITWENSEGGFKDGISGKGEFNFDGLYYEITGRRHFNIQNSYTADYFLIIDIKLKP